MLRFACVLFLFGAASASPAIPALFWSDRAGQLGDQSYTNEVLGSAQLIDLLKTSVAAKQPHKDVPEVMLGFVFDELRTDELSRMASEGSFAALRSTVEGAASSLVAPYTIRSDGAEPRSLVGGLKRAFEQVRVTGQDELLRLLQSSEDGALFRNGRTELLLVELERGAATSGDVDRLVDRATDMVSRATKGNYVAFVTAETGAAVAEVAGADRQDGRGVQRGRRALLETSAAPGKGPASPSNSSFVYPPIRMTPSIISGLVITFFMFGILLVAVCCMLSVPSTNVMLMDPPEQDSSHPQGIKYYPYKNLPIKEY